MKYKIPKIACLIFILGLFCFVKSSEAAPEISNIDGTFSHGQNIIIIGTGFGEKTDPVPAVWDDCSGTSITDKWSGGWPSASGEEHNLAYRTPLEVNRNISLPHSHATKYMCGAHYPGNGSNDGYDVMVWKNRTITVYPAYTYVSWYQRSDDNWQFGIGNPADDNYKCFDYARGAAPYGQDIWYLEYNGRPTSNTSGASWHYISGSDSLIDPDNNSCNSYGRHVPAYDYRCWDSSATNPMNGHWAKIEVEIAYTDQDNGYIKIWDNGKLSMDYSGPTDKMQGTDRNESIGGYARAYGSANNWRYFADIYLDYSRQRVLIGNSPTLEDSTTLREVQIPSVWGDNDEINGSIITAKVNQGGFADGQDAWLYVFDENGVSSDGYRIQFTDNGGDTTAPSVPSGLSVL